MSEEVETALTLSTHEQGTKVLWRAEVKNLGGLLKLVPSGLINMYYQQRVGFWGV